MLLGLSWHSNRLATLSKEKLSAALVCLLNYGLQLSVQRIYGSSRGSLLGSSCCALFVAMCVLHGDLVALLDLWIELRAQVFVQLLKAHETDGLALRQIW